MRYSFGLMTMLAVIPLASVIGCGDGGAMLAPELFGTWDAASLEQNGISTGCPGSIQLTNGEWVGCGTDAVTFNADGTFALWSTTDQFGDPYKWRLEGTWSTEGSALILTTTMHGPDGDNLEPLDPPPTTSTPWSVSEDTLALFWPVPGAPTITWYFRKRLAR